MTKRQRVSFDTNDKLCFLSFYPGTEKLPKHLGEKQNRKKIRIV